MSAERAGIVVAIDGPSGSGKSSTSRGVATRLGLRYLDGAWPGVVGAGLNLPDSAVLSGVVNDLCGPITDLLTSTSLLADNLEALPPATRSVVQLIQWRSLLLQSRSENLSCAAAVWDGRFQIHPQRVDLLEIIHEVRLAVPQTAQGQRRKQQKEDSSLPGGQGRGRRGPQPPGEGAQEHGPARKTGGHVGFTQDILGIGRPETLCRQLDSLDQQAAQ